MNAYTAVAEYYDRLNGQAVYEQFSRRISGILRQKGITDGLVLELACGTGTLARKLTLAGYEMICCDNSVDMLNLAREKCQDLPVPPVFICQDMCELDLYGTVRAAVCCLDSLNYLTELADLRDTLAGVHLFLEPGGVFIFDVKSSALFREMAGQSSVFEDGDCYCAWQYGFDGRSGLGEHLVDLFVPQEDGSYRRLRERHLQRAYSRETIQRLLAACGFTLAGVYQDLTARKAPGDSGRLLFVARKKKHEGSTDSRDDR